MKKQKQMKEPPKEGGEKRTKTNRKEKIDNQTMHKEEAKETNEYANEKTQISTQTPQGKRREKEKSTTRHR